MKTRKNRYLPLLLFAAVCAAAGVITGCSQEPKPLYAISSYRDIPGVTDEEIAAIEALRANGRTFSYESLLSAEAFVLPDGANAGFTTAFSELLSELFGIPIVQVFYEWEVLKSRIDSGLTDFTGDLTPTARRRETLFMTKPIAHRSLTVLTYGNSVKLKSELDLNGLKVGFLEGSTTSEFVLKAYPALKFDKVGIKNTTEIVEMLRSGRIDAFVVDFVHKIAFMNHTSIKASNILPLVYTNVSLASPKAELEPIISVVNKYLAANGSGKLHELYRDGYYGFTGYMLQKSFTGKEKDFLKERGAAVSIALESDNYPISFYNRTEKEFQGIAIDVLEKISKLTGIEFKAANKKNTLWAELFEQFRTGRASVITSLFITDERKENFLWHDTPYFTSPYAFLSKSNYPNLEMYQIAQAVTGAISGSSYEDIYRMWFPESHNLKLYCSNDKALNALEKGEVDLVLASGYTLLYQTNYREKPGYKINFTLPVSTGSYFVFNKNEELLSSIFNKTLDYIDTDRISRDWTNRSFDYSSAIERARSTFMAILIFALFLILVALIAFTVNITKNKNTIAAQSAQLKFREEIRGALNEMSIALLSLENETLFDSLNKGLTPVADVMNIEGVAIFNVFDIDSEERLGLVYRWNRAKGGTVPIDEELLMLPKLPVVENINAILAKGGVINTNSNIMSPDEAAFFSKFGVKSVLMIPVFINGTLRGNVSFENHTVNRHFDESEIELLRSAAFMCANAIIYEDLKREIDDANEHARLMLDSTPLCCQLFDSNFKKIDCNQEAIRLFGFKDKREFLERAHELYPEYQPDLQLSTEKVKMRLEEAAKRGKSEIFEWTYRMLDGTIMPAEALIVRLPYGDDFLLAGYTRDLREHARMMNDIEHRDNLLRAVNYAANALLKAETDVAFETSLQKGMEIIGACVNADCIEIWQNEMVDGRLHAVLKHQWLSETGRKIKSSNISNFPYSDTPQWESKLSRGEYIHGPVCELSQGDQDFLSSFGTKSTFIVPLFMRNEFYGIYCIDDYEIPRSFSDDEMNILRSSALMMVNAINRNAQSAELLKALELAEAGSKAKGDFLSTMSHEMRTPMNAIIGMTAIGKKAKDLEEKDHALNKIGDASSHLLSVINDVLDMAKIEANKLELYPVEYNFERMLQKVMTVVHFRADEKQQTLTVNIDEKIPRFIVGDDQRLAQIITNLLYNAVKFTPEGGKIHFEASLNGINGDSCELQIEVTDNGIGISPEKQVKLFHVFEQAESGTNREYGGTGLGLAIAKRIVELMDGKIRVESELGKGAKFIFTVKARLMASDCASGCSGASAGRNVNDTLGEFAGMRALLAEDIEINREVFTALLEDTGLAIDYAENGKEAVDMIEAAPDRYDIVFMDIQMPKMDGHEATRAIRALPCLQGVKLPIVAMTANVFKSDIEACLKSGMDDHLSKPVDVDKVLEALRKYLKQKVGSN